MPGGLTASALFEAIAAAAPNHAARQEDVGLSGKQSLARFMARTGGLVGDYQFSVDDIEGHFTETPPLQARLEMAWNAILPALRQYTTETDKDLPDRILVRNLDSATCAAFCMGSNGEGLIVVDAATHDLTYTIVKSAWSMWAIEGTNDATASEAVIGRTLRVTLGNLRQRGFLWTPFCVDLDGERLFCAWRTMDAAMNFILAHEYAHIALGHTETGSRSLGFGPSIAVTDCTSTTKELAADYLAAHIVMNPNRDDSSIELDKEILTLLGIRLALEALDALNATYFVQPDEGHPSPRVRFELIMRIPGLEGRDQRVGTLSMMAIADKLGEVLRQGYSEGDLIAAVQTDPVVSLFDGYDDEQIARIRALDAFETSILLPSQHGFYLLASSVFNDHVFERTPAVVRAFAEKEASNHELPSGCDTEEFIQYIVRSAAGFSWLRGWLPACKGREWALEFLEPRPGRPYAQWLEELDEFMPAGFPSGEVSICVHHMRQHRANLTFPFSESLLDCVWMWMLVLRDIEGSFAVSWPKPAAGYSGTGKH